MNQGLIGKPGYSQWDRTSNECLSDLICLMMKSENENVCFCVDYIVIFISMISV